MTSSPRRLDQAVCLSISYKADPKGVVTWRNMAPIFKPQTKSLKSFTFPWLAGMIKSFLQPSPLNCISSMRLPLIPWDFRTPQSVTSEKSFRSDRQRDITESQTGLGWKGPERPLTSNTLQRAGTSFTSLDRRTSIKGKTSFKDNKENRNSYVF